MTAMAVVLAAGPAARVSPEAAGVRKKLDALGSGKFRRGATVIFTEAELNTYARAKLPELAPDGARDPKLVLGNGTATGSAILDFVKLRRAEGHDVGWLLSRLLGGEKLVKVTAQIRSAHGKATVIVQRVEISGLAVTGSTLDFLIDAFLRPVFPDAKINQPFELRDGIERIEVLPGQARVITRR